MFPTQDDVKVPLLVELARRGGKSKPSDTREGLTVYESLAKYFNLTKSDLEKDVSDKNGKRRNKWENIIQWVVCKHRDAGLIVKVHHGTRGVWTLTKDGEREAAGKI